MFHQSTGYVNIKAELCKQDRGECGWGLMNRTKQESFSLKNYKESFAYQISAFNRQRKWKLFIDTFNPKSNLRILNVGFSEKEYSNTDNFIEKHYRYPEMITSLGIDMPCQYRSRYPSVQAVHYSGGAFPFKDKSFDVCWSNAVLEHVGCFSKQLEFIKEIKRVSAKAFITTPNRFFPIEVHTRTPLLHFLPKHLFDYYLIKTGKGWASGKYMNLLSLKSIEKLLNDSGIRKYTIFKNKYYGFVLDFVIIF